MYNIVYRIYDLLNDNYSIRYEIFFMSYLLERIKELVE